VIVASSRGEEREVMATTTPAAVRSRPTIRCLVDDPHIALPGLEVDLGDIEHPLMTEMRRIAPTSPTGQKRILSIDHPLVYRIRVSDFRGATWADAERVVVWLCAGRRREEGSAGDAFKWFAQLHAAGRLLPDADDLLRDRAEAATRLQRGLRAAIIRLFEAAVADPGTEHRLDLGGWIPARVLVFQESGLQEMWCAVALRGTDGSFVQPQLRDLLFATLETHVAPAVFEVRSDWPTGQLDWAEVVRFGIR
jgi:hypothetical protein